MRDFLKKEKYKRALIAFIITFAVAIALFAIFFISYTQKLKSSSENLLGSLANSINTTSGNVSNSIQTSLASSSEDKDVNEALNETLENFETDNSSVQGETQESTATTATENTQTTETEEEIVEEVKPVSFIAPVSGEIITDYAEDSLIFSNTLQEWTTHLGIDIKADKASVVVASEDGTVESIKNDPRYGLTITISHNENFETVYANLLSSEFVSEGDKVTQGQAIGTVGESASFEIAEVPHLHFEMYKDGANVNPTIYLNN